MKIYKQLLKISKLFYYYQLLLLLSHMGFFRISKNNKARHDVEKILTGLLFVCSLVAIINNNGNYFLSFI